MEDILMPAVMLVLKNIHVLLFGLTIGFAFGVIPGPGAAAVAALCLPFAIKWELSQTLFFIAGIYAGTETSGAIPSILCNTPGTAGAAATALDGYPMTLRGEPNRAIGISRMAGAVGGTISGVITLCVLGQIGRAALSFGPRELVLVAFLGIMVISTLVGDNFVKGLWSAFMGFIFATIGQDFNFGIPRATFNFSELYDGLPIVPILIGFFAVSEMFVLSKKQSLFSDEARNEAQGAAAKAKADKTMLQRMKGATEGILDTLKHPKELAQATLVGMVIGIIPGLGTAVANFISYGIAKKSSKTPEKYGTGCPEGIIASEACDNALVATTMIPTLALGVPGSATCAMVLTAFYMNAIIPGPRLMLEHPIIAYAIIISVIVGSMLTLPLGVILSAPLVKLISMKVRYLVPLILLVTAVGSYTDKNSIFEVYLLALFGVIGVLFRINKIPFVPAVVSLLICPIAERNFSRAYALAQGDWTYFFASPLSLVLWLLIITFVVIVPAVKQIRKKFKIGKKYAS